MKTNRPGLIAKLVKGAACALVLPAVLWSTAYLSLPERMRDLVSILEGRIILFGGLSSVAVAAALTFWVARKRQGRLAKRGFEDFGLARRWTHFLREHHTLFGWAAFFTAPRPGPLARDRRERDGIPPPIPAETNCMENR
jgi:hypothetical protein